MSNLRDFATGIINTPPDPASSGTEITLMNGLGERMPETPFKATVHPENTVATIDTAEQILVTARTGDTLTIERAQGETTAKEIQSGWRITNSIYKEDIGGSGGGEPAGGMWELLAYYDGAPSARVEIDQLPERDMLWMQITTRNLTNHFQPNFRFNGDSGTNYHSRRINNHSNGDWVNETSGRGGISTDLSGFMIYEIYNLPGFTKTLIYRSPRSWSPPHYTVGAITWDSTDVITSIEIGSGAIFGTFGGGREFAVEVYGRNIGGGNNTTH